MATGFFWDEKCFWHSGGNYAGMAPVGGLVQPLASGGLPENPETKRRLGELCFPAMRIALSQIRAGETYWQSVEPTSVDTAAAAARAAAPDVLELVRPSEA